MVAAVLAFLEENVKADIKPEQQKAEPDPMDCNLNLASFEPELSGLSFI